ncbi:MAG: hypothetical protein DSZ23_01095 [Thermodesulfatator sp.]|nr:MAG: hypothetical protein DSZ23_01095 [Thermodesulfatator sp.]
MASFITCLALICVLCRQFQARHLTGRSNVTPSQGRRQNFIVGLLGVTACRVLQMQGRAYGAVVPVRRMAGNAADVVA